MTRRFWLIDRFFSGGWKKPPSSSSFSRCSYMPTSSSFDAGGSPSRNLGGGAFVIERLAAGASELRDLYILAWRDSADDEIGWPKVKVAEVEAGTADPWLAMYGED